ncbi:MAG TPA: CehA/McbA family metallohydrolase [Steroidobacteraceae bacterium]
MIRRAALLGCAAALASLSGSALGHGNEARYVDIMNWKKDRITKVFVTNESHFDSLKYRASFPGRVEMVEGESCVISDLVALDVDDKYAFDIDETVSVTLTFATNYTAPFVVGWDKSGGSAQGLTEIDVKPDLAKKFSSVTLKLDRARFAGQGVQGSDLAVGIQRQKNGVADGLVTLCDIKVERSNTTPAPAPLGTVKLTIKDAKTGGSVPARVGLYDATGRAPLPSDKALTLQRYADDLRMLNVNERTFWPSENRLSFYVDSDYDGAVPAGTYELVVSRGLEYRVHQSKFEVKAGQTTSVNVAMERYSDMPSKGWYSGDSHIHVTRDEVADPKIWGFVAAEDVHVGNLLEMGNITNVYFHQPKAWGKASRFERDGHFIVSGQEAPRAAFMGHTVHFNIDRPIHLRTDEYFQYHKVFEEFQRTGGLSGFAHLGWSARGGSSARVIRGVNLLAPLGLVDFIEVLQGGRLVTDGWYRLLNLGIRVTPAAGTDWPYSDFPGVVRFFVKVDGPFNLDKWFESFGKGRSFVTNGPTLEFTINGKTMGEELRVKRGTKLDISALARLNPDVDTLDRLELVIGGDVTDTVSSGKTDSAQLRKQITADRSMWIAVRAHGGKQAANNMTVAHTAPIYVVVDGEPAWNRDKVPETIAELRGQLQELLTEPYETPITGNEPWETRALLPAQWLLQQPLLRPRIAMADAAYEKILVEWTKYSGAAKPIAALPGQAAADDHNH